MTEPRSVATFATVKTRAPPSACGDFASAAGRVTRQAADRVLQRALPGSIQGVGRIGDGPHSSSVLPRSRAAAEKVVLGEYWPRERY
jgi:hypothetical protein